MKSSSSGLSDLSVWDEGGKEVQHLLEDGSAVMMVIGRVSSFWSRVTSFFFLQL
jgi:hypothetical protein